MGELERNALWARAHADELIKRIESGRNVSLSEISLGLMDQMLPGTAQELRRAGISILPAV